MLRSASAHFEFVLIGGLAVAAWSEDFGLLEGGTSTFYSKDLDGPVPLKLSQDDYITRLLGHPRQKHTAFSQP